MPILRAGTKAPGIALKAPDGKAWSLAAESKARLVLLAFYKSECPVCRMAFPFVERISKESAGPEAAVVGISQNTPEETAAWRKDLSLTFPLVVDGNDFAVSKAYGLETVPAIFLVGTDGKIARSFDGFSKDGLAGAAADLARAAGKPAVTLFREGDDLPAFKPG